MKGSVSARESGDSFEPGIVSHDDKESTELSLFVRTSDEEIRKWDRGKIYEALIRETTISEDAASIVSREVEKMISELEIEVITAPLIRELTNAKLVEYGLSKISTPDSVCRSTTPGRS
jgi:anaerobic ribonucleoside-triphosphate reductase